MHGFMSLQTLSAPSHGLALVPTNQNRTIFADGCRIFSLPTPPPLLPIASPEQLLPLLQMYIAAQPAAASTPLVPAVSPLTLLPHATSAAPARPLPVHETNVLSDLCSSLRDVVDVASSERGKELLQQYLGGEARGLSEFWEGEWIVE